MKNNAETVPLLKMEKSWDCEENIIFNWWKWVSIRLFSWALHSGTEKGLFSPRGLRHSVKTSLFLSPREVPPKIGE